MPGDLEIIKKIEKQTGRKLKQAKQIRWNSRGYVLKDNTITALSLFNYDLSDISFLAGLKGLTKLDLARNEITDFSILTKLPDLTELDLRFNQIKDISFLAGLKGLTKLNLGDNEITDISILTKLPDLTELDLGFNQIKDISFLAGLKGLTKLDLADNEITDFSILTKLPDLTELDLWSNQIKDISFLAGLKGLTKLDLASNEITDISILTKLPDLTELDLRFNQIKDISFLAGLKGLTKLNLGGNEITDFSILTKLPGLTELDLQSNQIKDISFLAGLKGLTKLSLGHNKITDFSILTKLPDLTELDLQSNQIKDISFLAGLKGLTKLNLADNEITDFSILTKLPDLTELDLWSNQIKDISFLAGLKGLTKLDLASNEITDFSFLTKLPDLTELDLWSNQIKDISFLAGLKGLTKLDLGGNEITDFSILTKLPDLTKLDLWSNQIKDISFLAGLKGLTKLNLASNEITDISILTKLPGLTELDLRFNQIKDISFLAGLKGLTKADLGNNQIKTVPPKILDRDLEILWTEDWFEKGLILYDNPIESPPIKIVKQGTDAIRQYFVDLKEQGEEYLYEAKLIIVGEPGAGKTSLTNKLLDPQCELSPTEPMTKGIVIKQWNFPYSKDITFRANIWDFGGQDIMHSVHRYFLTEQSLYIVLADNRKEDTDFYYWLNMVEMLSAGSPILVVLNEKYKYKKFVPEDILKSFDTIKKVCNVDLADNAGLEDLTKKIRRHITGLSHVGKEPIPKNWVKIRETLENDSRDYIDLATYLEICSQNGVEDEKKALRISTFLHNLGVVLHFQKDRILKNTIILSKTWATEAVYLLLVDNKIIGNGGEFDNKDFERVWSLTEYKGEYHHLLRLMINFELCYEIENTQRYIIPELLPGKPPENIPSEFKQRKNLLQFRFSYTFMPKGIISRLIVRMNKCIHNRLQWKNGIILKIEGAMVEIVEDLHNRLLNIRIAGKDRLEALAVVRHQINDLHYSFENLNYDEMIPCLCNECANSEQPFFYEYNLLKKYKEKNIPEIRCDKSLENVTVDSLITGVFLPKKMPIHRKMHPPYIGAYFKGHKMEIGNINISRSNVIFAEHIDKIVYNENFGISKEQFDEVIESLKKLSEKDITALRNLSSELLAADSEEQKQSLMQKFRTFLTDHRIPIAISLTANAITELANCFAQFFH